jgi:hypothetical protein
MNYNDLHLVYNRHLYELPPAGAGEPLSEPEREPEPIVQTVVMNDPTLERRCQELEHTVDVCMHMLDQNGSGRWSPDRFPLMHIQYAAGYALGKWVGLY